MVKDLFTLNREKIIQKHAPLAERLRPKTLDEFVGQRGIIEEGRLLRRAIAADRVGNLLLHGPPGIGKTTLARIIALHTRSHFSVLNAVLAGVKELRNEVNLAKERLEKYGLRSILFVDEVHRFNSVQQDALLPWIENGTLTFIGATTENPFFEVNKALVSRSRLFRLQPLTSEELHKLLIRALEDRERGYGNRNIKLEEKAAIHLVDIANGDARSLLNALELAVESTPPDQNGVIEIDLTIAEESIQERAILYDKQGDAHFDTISAFIKSLRGSDPDAALFWLARMVEAGEDPKFIFRRMLIAASEDIGLADPQAIVVVQSCAASFDRIGLPEGLYLLAQAALYLAVAEKSNSLSAFFEAVRTVRNTQRQDVPNHLRDSHRDKEFYRDGLGYRYPHAFAEHWVAQQYLPDSLQGEVFWDPGRHGWEGDRRLKILARRSAQWAAVEESHEISPIFVDNQIELKGLERWIQRQLSLEGERLQNLEEKFWNGLLLESGSRVLMLGSSSLLWALNPLQRVQEGGITMMIPMKEQSRLHAEIQFLDFGSRPKLIDSSIHALHELPNTLLFECIAGRTHWRNISKRKDLELWDVITQKCTSNAVLNLLISASYEGPATLIRDALLNESNEQISHDLYEEIVSFENQWLNYDSSKNNFLQYLYNLRWNLSIDDWIEEIVLQVDDFLYLRWFGDGSIYKELLIKNLSLKHLKEIEKGFMCLKGKSLNQKLHNNLFRGKLNNIR